MMKHETHTHTEEKGLLLHSKQEEARSGQTHYIDLDLNFKCALCRKSKSKVIRVASKSCVGQDARTESEVLPKHRTQSPPGLA